MNGVASCLFANWVVFAFAKIYLVLAFVVVLVGGLSLNRMPIKERETVFGAALSSLIVYTD